MENGRIVACTLDVRSMRKRRKRWHDLAARAFVERAETERGLRLVFRDDPGVEEELRELARLEGRCCAFADWTVGTADGRTVLEVDGASAEAVAAVQSMFGSLEASASPSRR
jgi:hypothetical protein